MSWRIDPQGQEMYPVYDVYDDDDADEQWRMKIGDPFVGPVIDADVAARALLAQQQQRLSQNELKRTLRAWQDDRVERAGGGPGAREKSQALPITPVKGAPSDAA